MTDLSKFKKISIVGDIHGDYTIFKDIILQHINNFSNDSCLVFCGDYIDRGSDSDKICQFLFNLFSNKNGKEYEEFINMTNKNISYSELYKTIIFIVGNHEITKISGFDNGYNNLSRDELITEFNKYLNDNYFNFVPFCIIQWNNCSPIIISHASIKNLTIFTNYNVVWGIDKDLITDNKYIGLKTLLDNEKHIVNIHGHDHNYNKDSFKRDFNFTDCDVSLDNSDNRSTFVKLIIENNVNNNSNNFEAELNKYNYIGKERYGYIGTNEYKKSFKNNETKNNETKNNETKLTKTQFIILIIVSLIILVGIITAIIIISIKKRKSNHLKSFESF